MESVPQLEEKLKALTIDLSSAETQWAQVDNEMMQKLVELRDMPSDERRFALPEAEDLQKLWQELANKMGRVREEKMVVCWAEFNIFYVWVPFFGCAFESPFWSEGWERFVFHLFLGLHFEFLVFDLPLGVTKATRVICERSYK